MTELSEDIEVLTPGKILAEGRQEAGLTQQDVAEQLNLRIGVIELLEQDERDPTLTLTFTKGYLRSYARLLGISEQEVLDSFEAMENSQIQTAEMQSFSQKLKKDQQESRILGLTLVIILLIGASLVVWWWQQRQLPQAEFEPQNITDVNDASQLVEQLTTPDELAPAELPVVTMSQPQPQMVESKSMVAEERETQAAVLAVQHPPQAESAIPEIESQPQTSVETVSQSQPQLQSASSTAAEPTLSSLLLTFSADCWVEIFDSRGERLAVGLKRAGRTMPVEGVPPFKLKLGAPSAVAIEYNSENYPFDVPAPGRTLRLTIPK